MKFSKCYPQAKDIIILNLFKFTLGYSPNPVHYKYRMLCVLSPLETMFFDVKNNSEVLRQINKCLSPSTDISSEYSFLTETIFFRIIQGDLPKI